MRLDGGQHQRVPLISKRLLMRNPVIRRALVAVTIAFLVLPPTAASASIIRLPAIVRQQVKDINDWCSRSGGIPPKHPRLVRIIDLNGDKRPDYLVDFSHYSCRKAEASLYGGHDGWPVWIFVGGVKNTARLAYDDYSHGVEVTFRHRRFRVWLKVGALACGQPPDPNRRFAGWWFCSRPLEWNDRIKKFVFAALSEVRHIDRPR